LSSNKANTTPSRSNPHDLTGYLPSHEKQQAITRTIERTGVWLCSNEIYRHSASFEPPPGSGSRLTRTCLDERVSGWLRGKVYAFGFYGLVEGETIVGQLVPP
jgi:hypothetical protein